MTLSTTSTRPLAKMPNAALTPGPPPVFATMLSRMTLPYPSTLMPFTRLCLTRLFSMTWPPFAAVPPITEIPLAKP